MLLKIWLATVDTNHSHYVIYIKLIFVRDPDRVYVGYCVKQ